MEVEQIRHKVDIARACPFVDIVTVAYNSAFFLPRFFESFNRLEYPAGKLSLTVVDNASSDGTEALVNSLCATLEFPVRYIRLNKNIGFAGGANTGINAGKAEYVCIINPDTEFCPKTMKELVAAVNKDPLIGVVDAHQVPHEHPKYYDLTTGETSWCSGACCLIRRSVLEKIGLFDAQFFMYCEDVDLGWRVWSGGYKCVYAHKAHIVHHKNPRDYKPSTDYFYGVRNGLLMRVIYGGILDIIRYYSGIFHEILGAQPDPILRRYLWKAVLSHLRFLPHALWRRWKIPQAGSKWIKFYGWNYGENR